MDLPLIPQDKANHFAYGSAAALVAAAACAVLGHPELAGWAAQAAALCLGLAKEAADWLANQAALAAGNPPPHGVDPFDVLATWLGGANVHAAIIAGGWA